MLLSLVAHAVRYKMMVGVHNTVVVRCMWKVLPYSSCMVNDGAHNTVDVHRHVGGALPRLSGMGVDGAHTLYGKCRRPQHCLGSDMPRRLQGTLLTCPVGTVL